MKLKKGLPSRNELLVCTVKNISPHSAFVSLDEYEDQDAMLHISEVARGRIKNIETAKTHECPSCHKTGMKRESVGVWKCSKCKTKLAGKAYRP